MNNEGSGDVYYKGGSMLHMMRQLVDNDEQWRGILRGLNSTFYHQTVTGEQVRAYMIKQSGIDLMPVFRQYQTTTMIPALEYKIADGKLSYRWSNVVSGFVMPVKAAVENGALEWWRPTAEWQQLKGSVAATDTVRVDPSFYVTVKNAATP